MMRRVLAAAAAAMVVLGGVGACTSEEAASPFQPCPPESGAVSAPADRKAPTNSKDALPAITLPCFTGGAPVRLDRLGRPMVISLWASWCQPCRKELPELQHFADGSVGTVGVLGVVTGDTRSAAASLGQDLSVSFPMVFDERATLQRSVGEVGLPVTLFVDAEGRLRHVDVSAALTMATLKSLVRKHLDVVVP